jgi:hypothetical protein
MGTAAWIIISVLMAINIGLFIYFYTRLRKVQKSISDTVGSLRQKLSDMGLTDEGFKTMLADYKRLMQQESERIGEIDNRVKLTTDKIK